MSNKKKHNYKIKGVEKVGSLSLREIGAGVRKQHAPSGKIFVPKTKKKPKYPEDLKNNENN